MTEDQTERGLLAQILAEVLGLRGQVGALEVATAQVISEAKHRAGQVDDHELRLRSLEAAERATGDYVTRDDLEASQSERSRRTLTVMGLGLTAFGLIETAIIAVLIRG